LCRSDPTGTVTCVSDAAGQGEAPLRRSRTAYDPDEDEPLVTAAIMYYEAERSQEHIARHLGVSRPTVSRLLARARQLGIVRIQIIPPTVDPALANDLEEKLKLRGVHIAAGLADPADPAPVLAGRLDEALAGIGLQAGDVIVVAWGRALHSLAHCELTPQPGIVVAPALGGSDEDRPWFQPNEIARQWAATLQGAPRYLHAPAFVSAGLKRSLADEDGIGSTLGLWDEATAALVGIGAWPKNDPSLVAAGFSASDPAIQHATGDVVGRFFAEDGTLIHYADEPQLLAISADQLRRVPHVIGIAVGIDKAKAVVGAARAGLISTLVTDTVTARAIAHLLD
jgi:DNA-binding transcriptional regulator LsrR (DeoR family)